VCLCGVDGKRRKPISATCEQTGFHDGRVPKQDETDLTVQGSHRSGCMPRRTLIPLLSQQEQKVARQKCYDVDAGLRARLTFGRVGLLGAYVHTNIQR
jgi:hypothetical protein